MSDTETIDAETLRQLRSDRDRYKSDRDDAWARCAAGECDSAELERERADRLRGVVEALASALERTKAGFRLAVQGKPVRDMTETLAEAEAALAAVPSSGETESRTWATCSLCGHRVSEAMGGWRHDGSVNDDELDASHPIELAASSGETGERAVDDHHRGLYGKYRVERISDPAGKHADCRYFVLDPQHDPHAVPALRAYADACAAEYPALAADLRDWVVPASPEPTGAEVSR